MEMKKFHHKLLFRIFGLLADKTSIDYFRHKWFVHSRKYSELLDVERMRKEGINSVQLHFTNGNAMRPG